jgi:hypothetical protein
MRLQNTPAERREFAERLRRARNAKRRGFCETPQSALGEIHLTYGNVWALFDEGGPEPQEMLGGFVSHNLAMFPQSYPRPDLTYLPPQSVVECSELWALAPGAARIARHAGFILAGLLNARAILAYVMVKPRDTTSLYKTFSRVGEPINWHYVKAFDGSDAWGQAMVLEGLALEMTVQVATALSFESFDGQCLQFSNPFPIAPRTNRGTPRRLPALDRVRATDRIVQIQMRR